MFECKRCGFCCKLDVTLTKEDIKRIRLAGNKDFTITRNSQKFLKHNGEFCVFYKNGCSIYPIRPDVCKRFPFDINGIISEKCKYRKDFGSRVERRIFEFIVRQEILDKKRE